MSTDVKINTVSYVEDYIRSLCETCGVKLTIIDQEKVKIDGVLCNGYFKHHPFPEIIIAKKGKSNFEYLSLLLHEYEHSSQFIEKDPLYMEYVNYPVDIDKAIENWLKGSEVIPFNEVKKMIQLLLDIEIDCEKRVLDTLQLYDEVEMDSHLYAKKANAYLEFYKVMLYERKWYKTPPYDIEDIFQSMPNRKITNVDLDDMSNYDELVIKMKALGVI